MYDQGIGRKTEVISLRVPSEKAEMIRSLAAHRKISFNVLLNHVIDNFLDFDVSAKNIGYIPLPRKTVTALLELVREDEVAKVAVPTQMSLVELVYLMKGKYTLQAFLNTFFAWVRESRFAYSDNFEDEMRTISINHNMGRKWSLLLKEVIMTIMNELQVPVKFNLLSNILVFSINSKDDSSV